MSGNINDTNVNTIRKQIFDFKKRIDVIIESGEDLSTWENSLQREFKHLYKTSKSLFTYIFKNYKSSTFDEKFFDNTISMMLLKIKSIQNHETTQDSASGYIGTHLANKYIPQCRKN
jgi:hypothetical protein